MPIGLLIGVAAALALGSTLTFGPTDRTPADVAAYRRAVVADAEAADGALAALRETVEGAIERARGGVAATVSGDEPPGPMLEVAAARLEDGQPAVDRAQAELGALRGQLAIGGSVDAPRLLASSDDLASIAAQLRDSASSADGFARMRLATRQVLGGLQAVLVGLRANDLDAAGRGIAAARTALDEVRAWPGRLATLPVWIATADALLDALTGVVDARRDGDATREAQALDAYRRASDGAAQADRALAIAIAEGGGAISQAPLARLADLLAKIDATRASVSAVHDAS
ncbi:MAG TPA: hypothetical protein VFN14_03380 [Candidatus Limnocylindria bacterium]|nr:hypothetical protein [Candidatus Limnocylindria bacterium]